MAKEISKLKKLQRELRYTIEADENCSSYFRKYKECSKYSSVPDNLRDELKILAGKPMKKSAVKSFKAFQELEREAQRIGNETKRKKMIKLLNTSYETMMNSLDKRAWDCYMVKSALIAHEILKYNEAYNDLGFYDSGYMKDFYIHENRKSDIESFSFVDTYSYSNVPSAYMEPSSKNGEMHYIKKYIPVMEMVARMLLEKKNSQTRSDK